MKKDKIQDNEELEEESSDNDTETSTEEPSDADLAEFEDEETPEEINKDIDDLLMSQNQCSDVDTSNSLILYVHSIEPYKLLSKEEELALTTLYKATQDEDARQQLVLGNTRLVIAMARRLATSMSGLRLNILDLIQEGNIGLMTAIERFEPDKGFKFSTYASWWINQSMRRYVANQARTIRLPAHIIQFATKLQQISLQLTDELHRKPTIEEISEALDNKYPLEKIQQTLFVYNSKVLSLDIPIKGDEEDNVTFINCQTAGDDVIDSMNRADRKNVISKILKDLRPMERYVLEYRYGLNNMSSGLILEEVADMLYDKGLTSSRLTRERVRQIEACALGKIQKNPAKMRLLREIM